MSAIVTKGDIDDKRKKRIKRLKHIIIVSVTAAVLLPSVLCIFLFLKIGNMQKQIDELYDIRSSMEEQNLEYNRTEGVIAVNTEPAEAENVSDSEPVQGLEEKTDYKKVYLTFDDGPSSNTEKILNILAEYQIKATFFVIGKEDENSKKMYRRIVEEGHTLGMHTYSHQYDKIYESVEAFAEDVEKLQNYLLEVTGEKPILFRFPGGSSNLVSSISMTEFIKYLNEQGIIYFDWNVSSGDAKSKALPVDDLINNVMKDVEIYHTSIVLMHDSADKPNTVEALPDLIKNLKELELEILALTEEVQPIQHIKSETVNE